jgi:hypothetical protein
MKQHVLFGKAITRRTEKTHIRNFRILSPQLNLYGCKIKEVKERGVCSKRGEYERVKNEDRILAGIPEKSH